MPTNRNAEPSLEERIRRLPELLAAHALPIGDVSLYLDVPMSTLDLLRAKGQGPKCFKIGRRLYVLKAELHAWLERLAESEAA
jgi:predicted DNA-binding transcriptional regulator AlpA